MGHIRNIFADDFVELVHVFKLEHDLRSCEW